MNSETHSASEENVKVIQESITLGTLYESLFGSGAVTTAVNTKLTHTQKNRDHCYS